MAASSAAFSERAEVAATPDGGFVLTLSPSNVGLGGPVYWQVRSAGGTLLDTGLNSASGDQAFGTVAAPNGAAVAYIQGSDYDPWLQLLKPDAFVEGFALAPPSPGSSQFGGSVAWINNYTVQVAFETDPGVQGSDGSSRTPVIARYLLVRTWTGDAFSNASETMVGDDLLDVMIGNGGNDTMDGAGGPDTMRGGAGSDVYYVNDWGDVVDETAAGSDGWDTVNSWINYTLGANVEALALLGGASINGVGNAANNRLSGNAGNNWLDGSFGADTMAGGDGNDSYIVDNAGDLVDEFTFGSGWDAVYSSIDYALGPNIEVLVLTGTLSLKGTGNALGNLIVGNVAANVLKGGGGADTVMGSGGKDTIDGGAGKDIADYSDKAKAISVNLDGSKTVTVKVGSKSEDKIKNVEGIVGSIKNDKISGDGKDNVLNGGLGKDQLKGEGGKDQFVFNALGPANTDKIADFKHNTDKIALEDWVFSSIGPALEKAEFYAKAGAKTAHDADDRIVYNKSNGNLYYDSDGKGGAAAVLFATLSTKPTLDHGDFIIV